MSRFALAKSLLLLSLLPPVTLAATLPDEAPWTFNLYMENDLFSNTDRNYTNGVRLSWVSPDLTDYRDDPRLPDWVGDFNRQFDRLLDFRQGESRNLVISVGQLIYTPEDNEAQQLIEDDRPYAGYLYTTFGYHARRRNRLDSVEVNLGWVGPSALGEQTQDLIHDLRNIETFAGWDNQLRDEPTIQLVYETKHRLFKHRLPGNLEHDFISHGGGALGNVGTYLNGGGEYRLGWDLPDDFGTSAIRPAGDNSAPGKRDPRLRAREATLYGFHVFLSLDARLVLRDIFLDGNTWKDSHSVDKEPVVVDAAIGFSFLVGAWKLSYAQVVRTREFEEQPHHHEYGSVSISYTW
jgi:hypothetical protein